MSQVIVFATVGSNESTVSFDGTTWSDLQGVLSSNNITYKGMVAIIGESQVTLEQPGALTPTGDFTLFLLPVEVKSGVDNDADFDEDFDEADYNAYELPAVVEETEEVVPFLSQENIGFMRQLDDAIDVLNMVKQSISTRTISDPHIMDMQRRAAILMANRGR